jgi:alanine dehydrogenase
MSACIGLMEQALASLARGEVVMPLRPTLRVTGTPNVFSPMAVYSQSLKAIGTKLITVFPDNHGTEFDSHQGVVVLIDGEHGHPVAVMDAASITAIRTAAVSGVATRLLAKPDAKTVAILGSGVQGHTHIDAMLAVHPFEHVVVWSRHTEHARALVDATKSDARTKFSVAKDAESAVRAADVVCTVTAASEPVLRGEWLRPGTHLNVVGSSSPVQREVDTDTVRRARVFTDSVESAINEAGDLIIPMKEGAITGKHVLGEIGQILTKQIPGRRNAEEITLFKSLGLAIEDLACAHYLHDKARHEQRGAWVELG